MWLYGLPVFTILVIANCLEAELSIEAAFQGTFLFPLYTERERESYECFT